MMKPIYKANAFADSSKFSHGTRLVLGTSGLGGVWGNADFSESVDVILEALNSGVLSFDTSPSYNRAEEFLGLALKEWKGDKPFVSTKVGRLFAEAADEYHLDYTRDGMRRSLENSLHKLKLDRVDLLFLHEPQMVTLEQKDEILSALEIFKSEGLTKMIGIGGNPPESFYPYIESGLFEVVSGFTKMDACNLTVLKKDMEYFQSKGMAYYAASALHMGLLGSRLEKYTKERPNNEWISNLDVDNANSVNEIAKAEGMPLAELAMRYLFSMEQATRVVLGARSMMQVNELISCWNKGGVSESIFRNITEAIVVESVKN